MTENWIEASGNILTEICGYGPLSSVHTGAFYAEGWLNSLYIKYILLFGNVTI